MRARAMGLLRAVLGQYGLGSACQCSSAGRTSEGESSGGGGRVGRVTACSSAGPAGVAMQEPSAVNQLALVLSSIQRTAGASDKGAESARAGAATRPRERSRLAPSSLEQRAASSVGMTGQSATVIARWPLANPQSAIPLLGRALTVSRPGTSLGRRAVQIKPYRMPASHEKQGSRLGP